MRKLVCAVLLVAGCKSGGDTSCSVVSVAGCQGGACSINVTCGSSNRELKCATAAKDAKTTECTCNSDGVVGKKVTLEVNAGGNPFTGDTTAIVKSACGW